MEPNPSPLFVISGLYVILHIAGIVLAIAYFRRCPRACALLIWASLLYLVSLIYFHMARFGDAMLPLVWRIAVPMMLQWVANGLMLMAVFAGRIEPERRDPCPLPVDDDWPPPVPKQPSASTDIKAG